MTLNFFLINSQTANLTYYNTFRVYIHYYAIPQHTSKSQIDNKHSLTTFSSLFVTV